MIVRLYDWGLARRLKSAAKARARRTGRKSARGRWWRVGGGGGGKWLWLVWLLANLARIPAGKAGSADAWSINLLGSMSLAFAGLSLSRARKMAELLTVGAERRVLWFYPLSQRDFFQWTTLRFVAGSTWIAFASAIVYFVARKTTEFNGWALRIAAPLAEWLVVLCIAIALVRHVDKVPAWLSPGLYVAAALMLFVPDPYGKAVTPLASALPTGWIHVLMTNTRVKEWTGWVASCAVLALGFLCWQLLRQLGTIFCGEEAAPIEGNARPAEEPRDVIERFGAAQARAEGEEASEVETEATGEAVLPIQAAWQKQRLENWGSEVAEALRDRQWLNRWNWEAMRPIERVVGWCLNEQEKGVAQFLLGPTMPSWSNRWRTAAIATAVGAAAVTVGTREFNMLSVLACGVSIAWAVPLLGGAWPATNQGRISGKFSPIFGCYPLSYRAAGWIMFKVNAIRTAAWVPLGLIMAALNTKTAHTTIAGGCWLIVRVVLLFLGVAPILSAGKFSKVTNDTLNLRLGTIPLLGLFTLVLLVVSTLSVSAFMASGWWQIILLGGVGVVSWLSWALYGWHYERGQVDLLREQA